MKLLNPSIEFDTGKAYNEDTYIKVFSIWHDVMSAVWISIRLGVDDTDRVGS